MRADGSLPSYTTPSITGVCMGGGGGGGLLLFALSTIEPSNANVFAPGQSVDVVPCSRWPFTVVREIAMPYWLPSARISADVDASCAADGATVSNDPITRLGAH